MLGEDEYIGNFIGEKLELSPDVVNRKRKREEYLGCHTTTFVELKKQLKRPKSIQGFPKEDVGAKTEMRSLLSDLSTTTEYNNNINSGKTELHSQNTDEPAKYGTESNPSLSNTNIVNENDKIVSGKSVTKSENIQNDTRHGEVVEEYRSRHKKRKSKENNQQREKTAKERLSTEHTRSKNKHQRVDKKAIKEAPDSRLSSKGKAANTKTENIAGNKSGEVDEGNTISSFSKNGTEEATKTVSGKINTFCKGTVELDTSLVLPKKNGEKKAKKKSAVSGTRGDYKVGESAQEENTISDLPCQIATVVDMKSSGRKNKSNKTDKRKMEEGRSATLPGKTGNKAKKTARNEDKDATYEQVAEVKSSSALSKKSGNEKRVKVKSENKRDKTVQSTKENSPVTNVTKQNKKSKKNDNKYNKKSEEISEDRSIPSRKNKDKQKSKNGEESLPPTKSEDRKNKKTKQNILNVSSRTAYNKKSRKDEAPIAETLSRSARKRKEKTPEEVRDDSVHEESEVTANVVNDETAKNEKRKDKRRRRGVKENKLNHPISNMLHDDWNLTKNQLQELRKKGVKIKFGPFTEEETELLRRNVDKYLKERSIKDPVPLIMAAHKNRKELHESGSDNVLFFRTVAEGINRPIFNIYRRLRRMYDPTHLAGRWTEEEANEMLRYYVMYPREWTKIGKLIGRSGQAVFHKYTQSMASTGGQRWTEEEVERLNGAIRAVTKTEFNAQVHTPIPWVAVAEYVGTRSSDHCRMKWIRDICWLDARGKKRVKWTNKDDITLIKRLYANPVVDEMDIDWPKLSNEIPHSPSHDWLHARWAVLKRVVPDYHKDIDLEGKNVCSHQKTGSFNHISLSMLPKITVF